MSEKAVSPNFRNIGIQVGGMAAIAAAMSYFIVYMTGPENLYGGWYRLFSFLIVVAFQIWAVVQLAKVLDGQYFFNFVKATLIVSILSMFAFTFIDFLFYTVIDPKLVDVIVERSEEFSRMQLERQGKTDKEIEATLAQFREDGTSKPTAGKSAMFFGFFTVFYFIVGLIISGISAAVLKSRKRQ